jgi:rSAM/selenodomain-associated transferase 2
MQSAQAINMQENQISVVVPVLNEAKHLPDLLQQLLGFQNPPLSQIVVVDAGSTDGTLRYAQGVAGVRAVAYKGDHPPGRATQMNYGASFTDSEIVWFIHADTRVPRDALKHIIAARSQGKTLGGFRFRFQSDRWLLKLNAWFTRFNFSITRGGDQTLFITRKLWDALGGYNAEFVIMEEYDLIDRAALLGHRYHRMSASVEVSARKYERNSWWQVQRANWRAFKMYRRGAAPTEIKLVYHAMLRHPKDE